jgi:hypothetical protein
MIDDEYPLGFRLALHRKDLGIALEMAGETASCCPSRCLPPLSRIGCSTAVTATRTCPSWPGRSASCPSRCRNRGRLKPGEARGSAERGLAVPGPPSGAVPACMIRP